MSVRATERLIGDFMVIAALRNIPQIVTEKWSCHNG